MKWNQFYLQHGERYGSSRNEILSGAIFNTYTDTGADGRV